MNGCPELAFKPQGATTHSVPPAPNSAHLNPNTLPAASNPHRLSSPLTSSSSSSSSTSSIISSIRQHPQHAHTTTTPHQSPSCSKANGGNTSFFVACDHVMVSPCETDFRGKHAVVHAQGTPCLGCYTKKGNKVNFSHTHGKRVGCGAQAQAPGGAVCLSTEAIATMRRGVRGGCYKSAG